MVPFFGCGRIRPKGPKSSVLTFAVDSLRNLETVILPFFEKYPLVVKRKDFEAFAAIVRSMRLKEHLTSEGFERLVRLAYGMNANRAGKSNGASQLSKYLQDPQNCT